MTAQASPTVARLASYARHGQCQMAGLAFAEGVDLAKLLAGTELAAAFGQSGFAFARGITFEARVKEDQGEGVCRYGPLLALLREHLDFDLSDVRTLNLRLLHPGRSREAMAARAEETRRLLREMAQNREAPPNLIDGAVLKETVGGRTAYYEADGIAFRLRSQLVIIEIKSFPIVDGQAADPQALASAFDQGALYILLTRRTLANDGFPPELVSTRMALVCPQNVGMRPCLHLKDVERRMHRIEALLESVPSLEQVRGSLGGLNASTVFEAVADQDRSPGDRLGDLHSLCDAVGTEFGPGCDGCGMYRFCRERAFHAGSIDLLDEAAARELVGIPNLQRAAALAAGAEATAAEAPAARALAATAALRDTALAQVPQS
jgi:hypothetical protein